MRMNVSVEWKDCPGSGRIEVTGGEFVAGLINTGTGRMDGDLFSFVGAGPCKIVFVVAANDRTSVSIRDTDKPFTFALSDVPSDKAAPLPEFDVLVAAEEDAWASL